MKKVILASLMPILIAGSMNVYAKISTVAPVTVDGGKINFTGSIVASPCAVNNGTDNNGQTVMLGQVPVNHFTAQGDTSTPVPFNIQLEGCDLTGDSENYTTATITFQGETVSAEKATDLAITGSAGATGENIAKNIGIQILQNGAPVKVDGSTATATQSLQTGNNSIPFSAEYIAEATGVTAGAANAVVDFKMTYN